MKITKIPRERDRRKKRVAAYCRVSTTTDRQEESYETQLSYYTRFIQSHADWEFAGVYSDERSGLKASDRPGFQRLIKDALDGKVDYILVKSISRFSRNIVDCQKYVALLHGNGVDVHFDKEGLDTADPSCSMMFSFLAAIAQDESRSISENVRWGFQERFKRGEYSLGDRHVFGYDMVDGKLVPDQDADAVRLIYQLYLEGKSIAAIQRLLTDHGVRSKKGQPLSCSGIMYVLQNEIYKGDRLLQKKPPRNYLTKRPDPSIPYKSYYLENDHEAIVDRETWDAVQEMIRQKRAPRETIRNNGGRPHFLFGKVFCSVCGEPMTRRTLIGVQGCKHKVWTCRGRHEGRRGNGCKMRNVNEEMLLHAIEDSIGCEVDAVSAETIRRVVIHEDDIVVEKEES